MFIKRYNQFVKNNKVNEDLYLPEDAINGNPNMSDKVENVEEEQMEEEGGVYIGQKMIQDLAEALGVQPDADGSISYNGKKVNFYSETEKFHVDKKKFSTVEEVVNYLQNEGSEKPESSEKNIRRDKLESDDLTRDFEDEMSEEKFESKSYKFTRKFKKFK
jgi:hypothetical protein